MGGPTIVANLVLLSKSLGSISTSGTSWSSRPLASIWLPSMLELEIEKRSLVLHCMYLLGITVSD